MAGRVAQVVADLEGIKSAGEERFSALRREMAQEISIRAVFSGFFQAGSATMFFHL